MSNEVKAWRIAMSFDGVLKLNLNLIGRKHFFFKTEAYRECTKMLLQMYVTMQSVGVSAPESYTLVPGYPHGHSSLDMPVKHIHMLYRLCRASEWQGLWMTASVSQCLAPSGRCTKAPMVFTLHVCTRTYFFSFVSEDICRVAVLHRELHLLHEKEELSLPEC